MQKYIIFSFSPNIFCKKLHFTCILLQKDYFCVLFSCFYKVKYYFLKEITVCSTNPFMRFTFINLALGCHFYLKRAVYCLYWRTSFHNPFFFFLKSNNQRITKIKSHFPKEFLPSCSSSPKWNTKNPEYGALGEGRNRV